ncbi:MAG TPA: Gfo/Idh/MocA family oxidoreductase, partial [Armatimonadetes bacterium]|nr:Gfo/Idh/MocA family oxidoreductase [Armatimonadota bacterium]
MAMSASVRVGFIGTGGIAMNKHLPKLAELEPVELVALCDVSEERVTTATQCFGGRPYTDYREMLDREELDALFICVPPFAHGDIELRALERGLHLFIEKPVVLDMDVGIAILEAVRKANVLTSVGYSRRYSPIVNAVRELLSTQTIAMVTANRWGGIVMATDWWRQVDKSGGRLVENATHEVDLMRYWVGDVICVYARYAQRTISDVPGATIPDAEVVAMEFSNGAVGYISTCSALTKGGGWYDVRVVIKDAMIHFTGRDVYIIPQGALELPPIGEAMDITVAFVEAIRQNDHHL